jgi:hypothetical protein
MKARDWDPLARRGVGNGGVERGCRLARRCSGVSGGSAPLAPMSGGSPAHSGHVTWDEALEVKALADQRE